MYLTLHLILAHFIADYPLQSGKLIQYKQNHILGIFLHSFVHFVISAIITLPFFIYSKKLWLSITIIFIIHSIIDQIKVLLCKHTKLNEFIVYVVDQLTHVLVVYLVAVYMLGQMDLSITGFWTAFYLNPSIISFLLILVLVTYFYDISKWVYLNDKKKQPYKRDYKGMLRNTLIVMVAFVVYWVL